MRLVLDDLEPLVSQAGEVVEHLLEDVGRVPFPVVDLVDDSHRVPGPVGLGDVAVEPLVGDVRVILEGSRWLDRVDVAAALAPRSRESELCSRLLGRERAEPCGPSVRAVGGRSPSR